MRKITFIVCLLVAVIAMAQYSGPGYYRVHNVGSDSYICIKGTSFVAVANPSAFWPCVKMTKAPDQVTDPGSIIYIPDTVQVGLYAQGVDTYSLTGLLLDVIRLSVMDNNLPTYAAYTVYQGIPNYFRDLGCGMTPGSNTRHNPTHWWIEPVNEASMDSSYFAVQPTVSEVVDSCEWYWATMCCDFPILIPENSGVEGAYTVKEITMGSDSLYYAEPVKICGKGEVVPAATPVLLKCANPDAEGNKLLPVGELANHRAMPIVNDLLMGNYFSNFINHASMNDPDVWDEYIPAQATKASASNLALGMDADGKLGFFPLPDSVYMASNSAWLSIAGLELDSVTTIYLGKAPVVEPVVDPDPEPDPDPDVMLGDLDGDEKLTIADVTLLISYLINNPDVEEPNLSKSVDEGMLAAADINEDELVNVTDLAVLISVVLNMSE